MFLRYKKQVNILYFKYIFKIIFVKNLPPINWIVKKNYPHRKSISRLWTLPVASGVKSKFLM